MIVSLMYLIMIFTYVAAFISIWMGMYVPTLAVWICVPLIMAVFAWFFLGGIRQIRSGRKVDADILPVTSMSKEEIKAYFKCEILENDAEKLCIAKYEIDGTTQRAMIPVKKQIRLVPGNRIPIYVVTHKVGVKKEYQVFSKWNIIMDCIWGIPFVIAILGWTLLFVMRGL